MTFYCTKFTLRECRWLDVAFHNPEPGPPACLGHHHLEKRQKQLEMFEVGMTVDKTTLML